MRKIRGWIQLVRLQNVLIAAAGVWLGAYLLGESGHDSVFFTALAIGLVCAAGNAANDYFDIESDRVNHPRRPLVTGDIRPGEALAGSMVLNLSAVIVSLFCQAAVVLAVMSLIIILLSYNLALKRIPPVGNLVVAVVASTPFLIGGWIAGEKEAFILPGAVAPTIFAFLFHLGRELVKDLADREGDLQARKRILTLAISPARANIIVSFVFAGLIAATTAAMILNWYRPAFAIITTALINVPLVIIMVVLIVRQAVSRYILIVRILKVLMIFGLIAFLVGKK